MRLRPSLIVLPVLAVALLASGCFESKNAGTVSTPITVNVGTTETEVNPSAPSSTPATSSSTAAMTTASTGSSTATTSTTGTGSATAYPPAAKAKFATTCGGCHTLADAGTHGNVGPNLDGLKPNLATVEHQIANGGGGMPAGLLSGQDLKDVAEYVSSVAGKSGGGSSSSGGTP